MRIVVHYLAHLRQAASTAQEHFELPGSAVLLDLLKEIAARHGSRMSELLFDGDGRPRRSLLFFVENDQVASEVSLSDGEEVTILAPMAGG